MKDWCASVLSLIIISVAFFMKQEWIPKAIHDRQFCLLFTNKWAEVSDLFFMTAVMGKHSREVPN